MLGLVGCAHAAPESPLPPSFPVYPEKQPEPEPVQRPGVGHEPGHYRDFFPPSAPDTEPPEWNPTCEQRKERLKIREAELEQERQKRIEYMKAHCTGVFKQDVIVYPGGAERTVTAPTAAYMCDGRPVDAPYTAHEVFLIDLIGEMRGKIRKGGC